ncbi:hypothetical protein BDZ97DRAFT_1924070 [Flammula alnicola]|nr:hypothetical protein BDZ97DRAFT_1924070 [Flammula alnicola]
MADPLSVTLAVITLATALKDIIELGQKIKESFAQVSKNLQNGKRLAFEMLDTLYKLQKFCDEHYAVLNASTEMKIALQKLAENMKSVYMDCCKLIPPLPEKRIARFKITFNMWKNGDKVEGLITELKNHINGCHTQFMATLLVVVQQSNADGVNILRREISEIRVSDQQLSAFAGASSTTMSKRPSSITEGVISDMYLRVQINAINESLTQLSTMSIQYVAEPQEQYVLPFQPLLDTSFLPRDRNALHRDVVNRTLEVQALLQNHPSTLSIQDGAWEMVNLTLGLYDLNMYEEAAEMGLWAVNLFRTLVAVHPDIYTPYLIHALRHLSRFYQEVHDLDGAYTAIEECVEISRGQQTHLTPVQLRIQFGGILTTYGAFVSVKEGPARSLEVAEEAVKVFEDIFQFPVPLSPDRPENVLEVDPDFLRKLWSEEMSEKAICDYARAIRQLGFSLFDVGRVKDSIAARITAFTIFHDVCLRYPDSSMELELADILFNMREEAFRPFIPRERLLPWLDECIKIYRKYAQWNAEKHGRSLCDALWEKAYVLGQLERDAEALEVWKETIDLAKQLVADQIYLADVLYQVSWSLRTLQRHDEAAMMRTESVKTYQTVLKTTSETEADGYYDLAIDLRLAGRFEEAIQAAENALTQYRTLAFANPDQFTKKVARGLTTLANTLLSAGQCDTALNEGYEALALYEKLIHMDPGVVPQYIFSLRINASAALVSDNEAKSIERTKDVARHFRALSVQYQSEVGLGAADAELNHACNLERLGRIEESSRCIQDLLGKWKDTYGPVDTAEAAVLYIDCSITYACILDNQGHSDRALELMAKSIDIGKPFSAASPSVASRTAGSMYRQVHLLRELGRYPEALHASKETMSFVRHTPLEQLTDFVGSLHAASLALLYSTRHDEAIETAKEAVKVCRSVPMEEYSRKYKDALLYLPRCLYSLSAGLADSGNKAEALTYARQAPTYMDVLHNLSVCLLANGDVAAAADILAEVKTFLEKQLKSRTGIYTDLAVVLHSAGVLYCALGRHEEGMAAAYELSILQARLATVFPSLARQVKLVMDHNMKRGSTQALLQIKHKLECRHQDEHWPDNIHLQAPT